MLDGPITFSARFDTLETKATADGHDVEIIETTIPAYSKTGELKVVFVENNIPGADKTIRLEIGAFIIGDKYVLSSGTTNPKLDLTLKNKNKDDALSIAFGWDTPDDFDIFIVDEAITARFDVSAGSDNPEVMSGFSNDFPDDTYYMETDPYDVASTANFTVSVGYPDQSIEFFTGKFDMSKLADYQAGNYGPRVLKIIKSGTSYTCSLLPEYTD